MRDPRFVPILTTRNGRTQHAVMDPVHRTDDDPDRLYSQWERDVLAEEIAAGRRTKRGDLIDGKRLLTREELARGANHPDSREPLQFQQDRERRERELNPDPFAGMTNEERINAGLAEKIERQRVETLPSLERAKWESDQRLAAERKQRADTEARAHLLAQPATIALMADLKRLATFMKHDASCEQREVEEIAHQIRLLERTGDAVTIKKNLDAISARLLQGVDETIAQLRQPIDLATMRRDALIGRRMTFDREPEHVTEGGLPKVILTYAGQTKTIHKAQFDGMEPGVLLQAHFNVGEQP